LITTTPSAGGVAPAAPPAGAGAPAPLPADGGALARTAGDSVEAEALPAVGWVLAPNIALGGAVAPATGGGAMAAGIGAGAADTAAS
jgi:hypothetical protein